MNDGEAVKTYHRVKDRFFYIELGFDVLFLLIFQLSGLSMRLRVWAASGTESAALARGVYILFFCLGLYILHLPMKYFLEFIWEHKFQLSTQPLRSWLFDEFKKLLLSCAFMLAVVETLYFFLERFPQNWWVGAGGAWLFLSLFLARIVPSWIIPLFYKYSPIENQELKARIFELFQRCRIPLQDVYALNMSSKTKKANAFICGLGRKRRVVLGDTLLENFTIPEIEAVMAHELGHYAHKDIVKLIMVNAAVVSFSFYVASLFFTSLADWCGFEGVGDIAGLPVFVLLMMALGLLLTPLLNAFSRFLEREADRFCLEQTADPDHFVSMMEKLGEINWAEKSPHWFKELMFYDHPPLSRRIRFARQYKGKRHD